MSRTSRVPYHQNVYDLLGIEPAVCPDAARMIAEHEAARGPLPASVQEWYSMADVLDQKLYPVNCTDLTALMGRLAVGSDEDEFVLGQYSRSCVDCGRRGRLGVASTWLYREAAADPDTEYDCACGSNLGDTFSQHLWDVHSGEAVRSWFVQMQLFWLRTPAEPFAVPVIDFLAEQFGEPERTPRDGDVTTYSWRPDGGTIRVTADDPAHPDPLSAWWVHAASAEQLAHFARLLRPWGTLAQALRADTDEARAVWGG